MRYYTGAPAYRRKGPPVPVLFLHKASFVLWAAVMTVHVLAYVWRLPRLIGADLRRRGPGEPGGTAVRWALLALSLGAGVVIALAGTPLVSNWTR